MIGPGLAACLNLYIRLTSEPLTRIFESWKVELVVTAISLLVTAIYLTLLKLFSRNRIQQTTT